MIDIENSGLSKMYRKQPMLCWLGITVNQFEELMKISNGEISIDEIVYEIEYEIRDGSINLVFIRFLKKKNENLELS